MRKTKWKEDVMEALKSRDMTLSDLSVKLGYSPKYLYAVVNGRYSNRNVEAVTAAVNKELGTKGFPERGSMPSEEWCNSVRFALIRRKLSVKKLAESIGVKVDTVSNTINGKSGKSTVIEKINNFLNINTAVTR